MEDRTTLLRINELWKDLKTKGQNHSYLTYLEQLFFCQIINNFEGMVFYHKYLVKINLQKKTLFLKNSGQRPTQSSRGIIKDVEFAPSSKGQEISKGLFLVSSFGPKIKKKILRISALANFKSNNFTFLIRPLFKRLGQKSLISLVFWSKRWHKKVLL